jgi:hypothetical protein
VAQNTSGRRSAIDRRTTRHCGYEASQRIRKRIEEAFGWIKAVASLRKTKLRGLARVDWSFTFMTGPESCQIIGRWRIVEADILDRDHLELDGPAISQSAKTVGPGSLRRAPGRR